jgi:hypothetical protein
VVSLEAMSRSKAVIGSAVGGITDIVVDGETGYLTEPGDVGQLARRMEELIANPELSDQLGQAGKVRIQLFTSESVLPRFERLYDSLLETPTAPGRAQRILIVGGSGSGKTTIGAELAARRQLPIHHLDDVALAKDGSLRPIEARVAAASAIAAGDDWVVEGIYTGWTAELYERAQVIVWLDAVSWPTAVRRVMGRFAAGAVGEMRQRGLRGLIRPREQLRHALDLVRSIRETRAYYADGQDGGELDPDLASPPTIGTTGDTISGRDVTSAVLSPLRAKVVHCRSARDVRRMLEQLG